MMRDLIEQPSMPEILVDWPLARDKFLITDVGGLVSVGRETRLAKLNTLEQGAPRLTALADRFMSKFEDDIFLGHGWHVEDSVVGGMPNVPALLVGSPFGMRTRRRNRSPQAPLTIMLELTGSSGTMGDSWVQRGAAMLALARMLANTRAVEMWILVTFGHHNFMNMIACRVDTAPMDVGRAAVLLCHESTFSEIVDISKSHLNGNRYQSWSYGSPHMERKWSGEALRRVITPSSELLFIPAAYSNDEWNDPEKWVRAMLAKYGMGAIPRDGE